MAGSRDEPRQSFQTESQEEGGFLRAAGSPPPQRRAPHEGGLLPSLPLPRPGEGTPEKPASVSAGGLSASLRGGGAGTEACPLAGPSAHAQRLCSRTTAGGGAARATATACLGGAVRPLPMLGRPLAPSPCRGDVPPPRPGRPRPLLSLPGPRAPALPASAGPPTFVGQVRHFTSLITPTMPRASDGQNPAARSTRARLGALGATLSMREGRREKTDL